MESFLYGGIAIDYYNIVEFVSQGECKYFHEKYKTRKVISASFKNRTAKWLKIIKNERRF